MRILENYLTHLQERIPFTTDRVKIEIGESTDVTDDSMLKSNTSSIPCIVVNNLRIFTFKASFLFYSPTLISTLKNGGSCKGVFVGSKQAQNAFDYSVSDEGTGVTTSFFMGMPKPTRTFDTWQRYFNDKGGIRIKDFDSLHTIDSNQILDFSIEKMLGTKLKVKFIARLRVYNK